MYTPASRLIKFSLLLSQCNFTWTSNVEMLNLWVSSMISVLLEHTDTWLNCPWPRGIVQKRMWTLCREGGGRDKDFAPCQYNNDPEDKQYAVLLLTYSWALKPGFTG